LLLLTRNNKQLYYLDEMYFTSFYLLLFDKLAQERKKDKRPPYIFNPHLLKSSSFFDEDKI